MSEDTGKAFAIYPFIMTDTIKFWCLIVIYIPSIICALFTLYNFLFDATLRKILNNHVVIIVLLISLVCQVTVYPWMLYFYYFNGIWKRPSNFCNTWAYIDGTSNKLQTILFAWATVERHILIFHDRWLTTKTKRLLLHYVPLIILFVYCIIFYMVADFFTSCQNKYYDVIMICTTFCIVNHLTYYKVENIAHKFVPTAIILVFTIALLPRVFWQKIRAKQPVQWRKHRKMTIQILSISFVYLLFYFPSICVNFMVFCGIANTINANVLDILAYLTYFMILFLPFVCMLTLPNLGSRVKYFWRLGRRPPTIHPTATIARQPLQH